MGAREVETAVKLIVNGKLRVRALAEGPWEELKSAFLLF
jgi:hypothetical protein